VKLLSLNVEHFRCIRKAAIEFGPGLNVLHGPNDLGKSSLAAAIRAVLLLQSTSRDHEEFLNWNGTGNPHVELAFESEPQRIWKVRKTFGASPQAYLDESRDGVDFQLETRGREVDGRLSQILRWGLAPPGGKGRPKGLPMTFLSTALLAEQDRVAAIFEQALSGDSDESGKKSLIEALQAVAEDPLFKKVLSSVQARVDEAFTGTSRKKLGKNSPWIQIREMIRRAEEEEQRYIEQSQKSAAIEIELQGLHSRQLERRAAVETAQQLLEQVEAYHRSGKQREEILARLADGRARLAEIARTGQDLALAEEGQRALIRHVEKLAKREQAARAALAEAVQRAQAAKDEVARQQSEGRARERLLKRTSLEKRGAELQTEEAQTGATLDRIRALETAAAKVQTQEQESLALTKAAADLERRHGEASQAVHGAEEREHALRDIRQWLRYRAAREGLEKAEQRLAEVTGWREEAGRKRAAAAAIESALAGVTLPSAAYLADLKQLDHQLQVARARLDVGLHVRIRPKKALRVSLRRDGAEAVAHELKDGPLEAVASHQIHIDIEKLAEIAISGGAQDARDEVARLQARWLADAEPALERANAVTLDHLARMAADAALRTQEIVEARRAAAQLEQRVADQPDWAGLRAERQRELAAAEEALGDADRSVPERSARQLKIYDLADAEARLEALRGEGARLADTARKLEGELSAANARSVEKRNTLGAAGQDLLKAQSGVEGDWKASLRQVQARQAAIRSELAANRKELEALAVETDQTVTAAKKALDIAERNRAAAEADHRKVVDELRAEEKRQATTEGELKMRREAVAKLDEGAARAAVEQVQAELQLAPEPPSRITDEMLAQARESVQAARDELRRIEDEIHARRGALQHVGGDVARQKLEAAQEALKAAREQERLKEIEYAAWDLLRTTLLQAEQEEGVHLGRALGDPIAQRFGELTDRRYGKLALGPDLETQAISAAGDARPVSALSVGTRDQLSTIFRLSLAEQLHSTVLLDDQLTQSDAQRMAWLRDLIRALASSIQILVFTCRPADYLLPGEIKAGKKGEAVRSINLAQAIER
jgi:hypothetical protein